MDTVANAGRGHASAYAGPAAFVRPINGRPRRRDLTREQKLLDVRLAHRELRALQTRLPCGEGLQRRSPEDGCKQAALVGNQTMRWHTDFCVVPVAPSCRGQVVHVSFTAVRTWWRDECAMPLQMQRERQTLLWSSWHPQH